MAGKRSNLICPRCDKLGGFLCRRWVKCEVQIPRDETITNMYEAWDYASRVCLRLRDLAIILQWHSHDESGLAYPMFSALDLSTEAELLEFEKRHYDDPTKSVTKIKSKFTREDGSRHIKLPENSGQTNRISLSYLYCAIVCLVLRDISPWLPLDQEIKNAFTECLLAIYGTLRTDLRYYYSVGRYVKIISSVPELGYRGASLANQIRTSSCMKCKKMGIYSEMSNLGDGSGLVCEKCGCTDPVKVRISTKHLKNIAMKFRDSRLLVSSQYVHLFHDILESYNFGLRKPELKGDFMRRFGRYEELARKDLLGRRYAYFIGHYDPKKPNRKRWCSLNEHEIAHIKINDPVYFNDYKRLVAKYVQVINDNNSVFSPIKIREKLQDILTNLSWPETFIEEKINQDSLEIILLDKNVPTPQHVNTLKENIEYEYS